jgi:RNA polymerase sigma-70 factor (ECF subfamily)
MSDPDEQLCSRARDGDIEAASELVSLFYERVYGWFRRLTGHDADAADLTQKTFCKVWRSLESFQGRSSFSTWLHGIGHHVYVDWRRQRRPPEDAAEDWWQTRAAGGRSPFEDMAERDAASLLYRLVEQLDDDTRQTVHLHYYEGLSIAQTAEALGVATSTVKYRLRQAIDFLRARVSEPKTARP